MPLFPLAIESEEGLMAKGWPLLLLGGAEKEKGTEAKSGEFERRKEKEEVGSLVRGGWSVSFALKRRSVKPGGVGVFG